LSLPSSARTFTVKQRNKNVLNICIRRIIAKELGAVLFLLIKDEK